MPTPMNRQLKEMESLLPKFPPGRFSGAAKAASPPDVRSAMHQKCSALPPAALRPGAAPRPSGAKPRKDAHQFRQVIDLPHIRRRSRIGKFIEQTILLFGLLLFT